MFLFEDLSAGVLLTRWTIRVALTLYLVVVARQLWRGGRRRDDLSRWLWSVACLIFLAHVYFAFRYYHDMSHQRAFEDTARQTEELMGFAFGAGIYFSYAFALLWLLDAAWWTAAPASYQGRSTWLHGAVHFYMFFIAFNGAIVFEGGVTRWGGAVACLLLAALAGRRWFDFLAHERAGKSADRADDDGEETGVERPEAVA